MTPHSNTTLEEARAHVLVVARKWGTLLNTYEGKYAVPGAFDEVVATEGYMRSAAREYASAIEACEAFAGTQSGEVDALRRELEKTRKERDEMMAQLSTIVRER